MGAGDRHLLPLQTDGALGLVPGLEVFALKHFPGRFCNFPQTSVAIPIVLKLRIMQDVTAFRVGIVEARQYLEMIWIKDEVCLV
jgi:hypothetical protein